MSVAYNNNMRLQPTTSFTDMHICICNRGVAELGFPTFYQKISEKNVQHLGNFLY